jgi:phospholipid/cholesterol/gamma-HCH transport system permease protein
MRVLLTALGEFGIFSGSVLKRFAVRRGEFQDLVRQMHRVGVESLTVVNMCAFFIGLVFVLQTSYLLAKFGAKTQVAGIVSASFVREIGPVFAAIMFAGRVGTGIAAEIGSMVVTEQIDAYRSFGVDPIRRLAVPRVLASMLMLPALTTIACLVGIFAGYLLGVTELGISGPVYLEYTRQALGPNDVIATMAKALVFGLLIGLVATYHGFRTPRATEAVGESTTKAMVGSVLGVLVADFLVTKLIIAVGGYS